MIDPQFFEKAHDALSLSEIAELAAAKLSADHSGGVRVSNVAPLDEAGPSDVSFLENKKYIDQFKSSKAGACFVSQDMSEHAPNGMICLITDSPYMAYAKTAQAFYPLPVGDKNIHTSAQIDENATIGAGVSIGPGVVVKSNATIGDGSIVDANTVISENVEIGQHCRIAANVTISHAKIGNGVKIAPGVRIGQPGFGFAMSPTGFVDVPQLGRVILEDGVDIGANTTIDRGSLKDTVVGAGTRIDNLVQLGHNVETGKMCVIVSQTGISGSTQLGDFVITGGQAGLAGHLKIASGVKIAAQSGIMRNIEEPGEYMGSPALPLKKFMRQVAMLKRMVSKKGD